MKNRFNIIFLLIIVMIGICGCAKKWEKDIQISALKYDDDYIVGKMKNLTNKAYDVTITFKAKSGSLIEDIVCYEKLKPNDTIDLNCLTYSIDETYEIEVNNVELEEYKIPELKTGKIDAKTLEYHFEEIYKMHTLNFISFTIDIDEENYPYIEEVDYNGKEIEINGSIKNNTNNIYFYETFDTNKKQLVKLNVFVSGDAEFINNSITNISLMQSISNNASDSSFIGQTLKRTDIEMGYCMKVGNWCISTDYSNKNLVSFSINRR